MRIGKIKTKRKVKKKKVKNNNLINKMKYI